MKKIILAITIILACLALPAKATTTVVSGSNVQYPIGFPLSSGSWCFGATCGAISNGSFSVSVTSATATVTITNGAALTYLSVPSVAISGSTFSWDSFIVTGAASGMGTPSIPCAVGAVYTQNDSLPVNTWKCTLIAGHPPIWIQQPYVAPTSFTLGLTPISFGQTYSAVTGLSVNGVTLNTGDAATTYLNGAGNYTAPVLTGTVTFTTATSDSGTVTGATSSSVCVITPTNATAAASTTIAYISAVSANTVTVTHVATTASGGTENILCN